MTRFESTALLSERGEPNCRPQSSLACPASRDAGPNKMSVRPAPSRRRGLAAHPGLLRGFDVAVSTVALALLLPLFAIIAVAIKVTSPGPIVYKQTRVGRNERAASRRANASAVAPGDRRRSDRRSQQAHGRPFEILKFRTMVVNAEEYGPQWSRQNDPRITPIGRFLRKTRLDETLQFYNVLRGDMSVIGPRPERPYFVRQFVETIPEYDERLRVRPGITGLAQVTLDYDSNIDDVKKKLEQDLKLVRHRSLTRDLGILARTAFVVVTGKGSA